MVGAITDAKDEKRETVPHWARAYFLDFRIHCAEVSAELSRTYPLHRTDENGHLDIARLFVDACAKKDTNVTRMS
jgi:hypothetical protein